jgi:serine/threonine-protein kinase
MAPEQISDEGEIGPATDIYALATVAYEMLTGRLPYESTSVMKMLMSKLRDEPTPATDRNPQLPARVNSILSRGLARKPEARWKSCAMMVDALAAVLEPKVDLFASTQPIRRVGRPLSIPDRLRRHWLKYTLVGVPILVAATVAALYIGSLIWPPGTGVVPCPRVSPIPPTLAADPNPAAAGQAVSYAGSGFAAGEPLFVVLDSAGDCTNPTAGVKVYSTGAYADPLLTEPSALPKAIVPGEYQLRACSHRTGEQPSDCVQVPFIVTAAGPAAPAAPTPTPFQTPPPSSPSQSPT